jgi:hypothetical protein
MKIPPVVAFGQMDRHDDANSRFRNFANALKKVSNLEYQWGFEVGGEYVALQQARGGPADS